MSRLGTLLLVIVLAGCADAPALVARGSDPATPHEDRVEDLREALAQREPGIAQDLVMRAEHLLLATGPREEVARDRACAFDVLQALVEAPDKSAQPLAVRLADSESPLLQSKKALEILARHPDSTVRGLARERLRFVK